MGLSVDRKLLPIKAHYFFFNAGTAPVVPFMTTYARQLGFSPSVVGTMYTFLPIFGMIFKPLFGLLSDRYQRQKFFFILFQLVTAVAYFGIMFVPEVPPPEHETRLECGDGAMEFELCTNNWSTEHTLLYTSIEKQFENDTMICQMNCGVPEREIWNSICTKWFSGTNPKPPICKTLSLEFQNFIDMAAYTPIGKMERIGSCVYFRIKQVMVQNVIGVNPYCPTENNVSSHINTNCNTVCDLADVNEFFNKMKGGDAFASTTTYQFWWFFVLLSLSWIGMAVVVSVSDTICFALLGENGHMYGHQRLWGSVGWGIFSLLTGFLVDVFSNNGAIKNYDICFYLMAVLLMFDMFTSTKLKYTQTTTSTNILGGVGRVLTNIRVVIFLLFCIMVGMCTALIWNFLFWHLEDLAKQHNTEENIKTLEGVIMCIQSFGGELPMFFLSSFILKKLGHIYTMHLVLLAIAARVLLYSFLSNPWWCLPIELLHGVSFGVFYATMTSYASIVAPLGTETTIQGLVGGVFEGVGVALGSFVGGHLMEQIGGALVFRYFGYGTLAFLLIHILVHYFLEKNGQLNFQNTKAFQSSQARYAIPADAIQMIDDLEVPLETF